MASVSPPKPWERAGAPAGKFWPRECKRNNVVKDNEFMRYCIVVATANRRSCRRFGSIGTADQRCDHVCNSKHFNDACVCGCSVHWIDDKRPGIAVAARQSQLGCEPNRIDLLSLWRVTTRSESLWRLWRIRCLLISVFSIWWDGIDVRWLWRLWRYVRRHGRNVRRDGRHAW